MITFLFVLSIFISVWFGFVNIARLIRNLDVSTLNILIMSIGITGVITHIAGVW